MFVTILKITLDNIQLNVICKYEPLQLHNLTEQWSYMFNYKNRLIMSFNAVIVSVNTQNVMRA